MFKEVIFRGIKANECFKDRGYYCDLNNYFNKWFLEVVLV